MRLYRVSIALLILVAVAFEFYSGLQKPVFNPANFFSFFTIVSNTFAAIVLLYAALSARQHGHRFGVLRGAAVLCMTIVGVVFSLLLANLELDITAWVNMVVHDISPVAIVLDWLIFPPQTRLGVRDMLAWLALPLVYILYTLARGAIVHWYPYPFLNVDTSGYASVFAYIAAIFVLALLVAYAVAAAGNALSKRSALK